MLNTLCYVASLDANTAMICGKYSIYTVWTVRRQLKVSNIELMNGATCQTITDHKMKDC